MLEFGGEVDSCTPFLDHLYQLIKKRGTRVHSTAKPWHFGNPSWKGDFI